MKLIMPLGNLPRGYFGQIKEFIEKAEWSFVINVALAKAI